MNESPVPPDILALQKRRKRYRKMLRFSLLGILTLAVTPFLYQQSLAFTAYGMVLFGLLAFLSHRYHARVASQLIARGY